MGDITCQKHLNLVYFQYLSAQFLLIHSKEKTLHVQIVTATKTLKQKELRRNKSKGSHHGTNSC